MQYTIKDFRVNTLPATGEPNSRYYVLNGQGTDIDEYVTDLSGNYHKVNPIISGGTSVKVSSNDSTPGFLNGKLVQGSNITFTENNDGGNETLTISASVPSAYTDEQAQDAIASILNNTDTISVSYVDATPVISLDVNYQMSLTSDSSGIKLINDESSPGNREFYSTSSLGVKGWRPLEFEDIPSLTDTYWGKLGNSGTSPSTNFIGTTDGQALQIKVNNERAGFIGYSGWPYTETGNGGATSFGYKAAEAWTNRLGNFVAIGSFALQNLASSGEDVAVGNWSLRNQTGGDPTESYQSRNVAVGQSSLFYQTIGSHNTAVGCFAGEVNRNGKYMTAVGSNSLRGNKQGIGNTGVGYFSLLRNTSGVGSVAITNGGSGYTTATVTFSSPEANTPGTISTPATGVAVISGGSIVSITITNPGSGYSIEPSGVTVLISGDGSGATGTVSLISGEYNTAVGVASLAFNRFGDYNTAVGTYAGYSGRYVYEDTNSTFLGANSGIDSSVLVTTVLTNATAIGYNARVGASNTMALGGTGSDAINVGINTISARKKLDVVGGDILVYENTIGRGNNAIATNTVFGFEALASSSVNIGYNTAIGYRASKNLTSAILTTAVGGQALLTGGGDYDTAFGVNTLWQASTGSTKNTALGYGAGFSVTEGNNNTFVGYGAGFSNTTGDFNIAIGTQSLGSGSSPGSPVLTGNYNIAIGNVAGFNLTNSSDNILIGNNAGTLLVGGANYNVILGSNDGSAIVGLSNHIILADGQGNQRLLINNNGAYSIGGGYGTSGYVLKTNGTGSSPSWVDISTLISTPTFQQTLIAGATLSQANIIDRDGFDLSFIGSESNDLVYFNDGDVNLSVGNSNNHASVQISKLTNGSSFQALIDSTGNTLFGEIDGEVDSVAGEGKWDIYVQKNGVFFSQFLANETGISVKTGVSSGTLTGISIDLSGVIRFDDVANDDTETKILVWNSTSKEVEYRNSSSLGGVTSFSFTDGNGFDGTVVNGTTTPTLSLTTTVGNQQIMISNSGAISGNSNLTYDGTLLTLSSGRFAFGTPLTFSGSAAGQVWKDSFSGLTFRGYAGSGYDIMFYDSLGNGLLYGTLSRLETSTDFGIQATKKIYFGNGSDTYLYESSADVLKIYTGGAERLKIDGTSIDSTVDITVPDEAYGVSWNGSLEVPTKNALYDKIETLSFNIGQATIDFGTTEQANASVTVADTSITGTSKIIVSVSAETTTEHTIDEILVSGLTVMAGNCNAGVGFTIYGYAAAGTTGTYKINYTIKY